MNRKLAKAVDSDRIIFLEGGLEEFKNPLHQRGRLLLRDPGFLNNALSDVRLSHWSHFPSRQQALLF